MTSQTKTILILLEKKETQLEEKVNTPCNNVLKKELRKQLKDVQDAKARLKDATYGFCEDCYKSIPWRELCSIPERRLCENCLTSA